MSNRDNTVRTVLRSDDLSCPSCVARIEKALAALPGVRRAEVRFNSGKVEIDHDPAETPAEALVKVLREAGYASRVSAF